MKINLNIENSEKKRILYMHNALKEQATNNTFDPTKSFTPNHTQSLANQIVNQNLCDFTGFKGWNPNTKEITGKPRPSKQLGRIGILGLNETNKNYAVDSAVFFDLENINSDGTLNTYLIGNNNGQKYFTNSQPFTCSGLSQKISETIKKVNESVASYGFKGASQFPVQERRFLNSPEQYEKLSITQIFEFLSNEPNFNPKLYPNTQDQFFYKPATGANVGGITPQQKQVISTLEKNGWVTDAKFDYTQEANYVKTNLKELYPNIFSYDYILFQPKKTGKSKEDDYGSLNISDASYRQCNLDLEKFTNALYRYKNDTTGIPPSLLGLKNKIQVCYNTYKDKKFGKNLEALDVIGDYANVPDFFKIKR